MSKTLKNIYDLVDLYEHSLPSFAPKSYMILSCFCFSFMALWIRLL